MNDNSSSNSALREPPEHQPWVLYNRHNRRMFLSVLFLVATCNYVDKNIIGVLLEQIKAEFHASDTMLGLLSGISFALFYATLGIPIARWADRGDRRLVITLSLFVWSVMTVLCGLTSAFWQLAVARFGVGAGEAGGVPASQSLLADYYSKTERARALGVFMTSGAVGNGIGLIIGGFVAQDYGWRAAFLVVGLFGITLTPLTHFVLREPRHLTNGATRDGDHDRILAAIGALLEKPAYRYIIASMAIAFFAMYGVIGFLVPLMIRIHGLSVVNAGAIFGTISAIGAIVGNLFGGMVADGLAARDITRLPRVAGWALILAAPLFESALIVPNATITVLLLLLSMTALNGTLPATYAALHLVCGSSRLAMSIAIAFFFANLIGLGLGPLSSGALSDQLGALYGTAEGLRYALMVMVTTLLAGGCLMLRAAHYLQQDLEE